MPFIMKNYDAKTEANIVTKVCNDVDLSVSRKDEDLKYCREICSERACCFFPGRDNCQNQYEDWCNEFAACKKVNLFANDDDYDDDDDVNDSDDKDEIMSPDVDKLEIFCT